jgi:hypothetical protein
VRFIVAGLMLGATMPSGAQPQEPRRPAGSMFIELAGNAAFGGTFNVETRFHRQVALRAGIGNDFYSATMVFPFQLVLLSGSTRSALEASLGVTVASSKYSGTWHWTGTKPFFTGFAGYRYQAPGGFLFRLGVIPLMWTNNRIPWVALSMGYSF